MDPSPYPVAPADGAHALQAVLLDMDGTLVDTEDLWWQAEKALFAEMGYDLADHHRDNLVGGPMSAATAYLLGITGATVAAEDLAVMINDRFTELLERGLRMQPGAAELLAELRAEGVPTALVSSSHRRIIDRVLTVIGPEHFLFTIAGDEVTRTKPHPEPYLTAARMLDADPARCVVLEDTPTGVAAGQAAGCHVLAVPSLVAIEPAAGRTVLPTLEGVDLATLRALAEEHVAAATAGATAGAVEVAAEG
ncbi:HAD family hydrolase [Allostreptomyces psammosilenae]|uniref:HAD family hydrolase n=1 Tax=Allostreptomyces psammosilenae TaxID=1892865 RepID=UPI0028AB525C|nr:HAD family phosphatase [Allostreptomyces psammosilenae]